MKEDKKERGRDMRLDNEHPQHDIVQVMDICGVSISYNVQRTIMKTGLYSVYLISLANQPNSIGEVLLIEHPPARAPSKYLLPLKSSKPLTTSELMNEIVETLEAHFNRKG
ncbi:hypothetical protein [Planomicrobium sp. CPCC 101079]|uniref:hypothetical protein n=1 Tax=Planomicrobium sp. CPCC 101079 TaxID=2599618 RepID=UPI0011B719C0|nr:hypothetical protein [Planomicrobium sp. CPCC 101079]TWT13225.1 hypothetical protein FQV28_02775 [Planomicrobium sp. CPCC 101079]